ncbi:MAG: FtsX-like permease family protein, partial [Acidobacteriota bacterium]
MTVPSVPTRAPLLGRASWRHLLRHRGQFALAVLGVAMGVAVVLGIDLANAAARRAFDLSVDAVAGRATHQLTGGPTGFAEAHYADLRRAGVRRAAPVIEGWVRLPDHPGRSLQVLGIDAFAEPAVRGFVARFDEADTAAGDDPTTDDPTADPADAQADTDGLASFLTRADTAVASRALLVALGAGRGDDVRVSVGGRVTTLRLIGRLAPVEDERAGDDALDQLLVVDVGTAQQLFDRVGRLDRIDLVLDDAERAIVDRVVADTNDLTLTTPESRRGTLAEMTRAFRLNLTALSLLALLVGVFLIYNTMTFAVVQRRGYFGMLRALGVTGREIRGLVLREALLLGAIGTALGLAFGLVLARGLVQLVARTINDLYFVLEVTRVPSAVPIAPSRSASRSTRPRI